jgi:hypothetical protein
VMLMFMASWMAKLSMKMKRCGLFGCIEGRTSDYGFSMLLKGKMDLVQLIRGHPIGSWISGTVADLNSRMTSLSLPGTGILKTLGYHR